MDPESDNALAYATEPDYAIAALMQMLVRYPMTCCGPLAASIEAHFDYIARDGRYSRPVRAAAARAGGEWKAMIAMHEELARQQRKCDS